MLLWCRILLLGLPHATVVYISAVTFRNSRVLRWHPFLYIWGDLLIATIYGGPTPNLQAYAFIPNPAALEGFVDVCYASQQISYGDMMIGTAAWTTVGIVSHRVVFNVVVTCLSARNATDGTLRDQKT